MNDRNSESVPLIKKREINILSRYFPKGEKQCFRNQKSEILTSLSMTERDRSFTRTRVYMFVNFLKDMENFSKYLDPIINGSILIVLLVYFIKYLFEMYLNTLRYTSFYCELIPNSLIYLLSLNSDHL